MANITTRPTNTVPDIDRMFSDFFGFPSLRSDWEAEFMPRVNIKDTKDNVVLQFELPGMKKEDIKVMVKDGNLIVSGERNFENNEQEENYIRREIRTGKFTRTFSLPDTLNSNACTADYRNGILEVKLAKLEEVKPKQIEVNVQ